MEAMTPSSSLLGNLSHISFSDFLGEIMTNFRERDVITGGFPQKSGIPRDFVYDFVS